MSSCAWAGAPQVGTLTQVVNGVKIFSNPGKTAKGPGPHVLYEGTYYSVKNATVGATVDNGNLLRTNPNAKARVVFQNGDQFNVGGGTAYRVHWKSNSNKAAKSKTQVNLVYGKIRGMISKGGPRSRMKIRTSSATMGVRGTDFFIADAGMKRGTDVSILRGKVRVKPNVKKGKPVIVKAGFSAHVETKKVSKKVKVKEKSTTKEGTKTAKVEYETVEVDEILPVAKLEKTTKEELIAITRTTKVEVKKEIEAEVTKEVKAEVFKLESKAVQAIVADMKKDDPKLLAKIEKEMSKAEASVEDINELQDQAVEKFVEAAPAAPSERKPYISEIDDLEDNIYDKYFKNVDD